MVNFNLGELRGFHGRWMLGGPHHPHLRHRKGGIFRSAEKAASGGLRTGHGERTFVGGASHGASSAARVTSADIKKAAETQARASGVSESMLKQAERQAGIGAKDAGSAAERASARDKAIRDSAIRQEEKKARRQRKRYHPVVRDLLLRGARGGGLMNAAYMAMYLHRRKKAPAAAKKPKKPPKKKAPPKAKIKKPLKAKAAVRPRVIRPPNVSAARRPPAGARGGRGAAQTVKPSSEVMANLSRYVNAPGGIRAGVGTAGRSSVSSTGRTTGSRVGGAGARSSGARSSGSTRMRTHG